MRPMMCVLAMTIGLASVTGCSRIREKREELREERASGDEKGIIIKDDDDRGSDESDRDRGSDEGSHTTTTTTVHD